ncbi:helix-turn-helix domain-containing protein [Cohnella ginsengisoli]|uniref:Helix-turn-helix domain-containing protein n=1 Tax=Cohnella ginsengisoli TaxID=425004 RepID=A0A9X4KHM5_9BACL|nr:helix-turn-helix domain-containing protein [Cohnella ginsengisoli]MDG0792342.1 helix-turn-helix domain-containing protein [Cohnella ginsengisoli]
MRKFRLANVDKSLYIRMLVLITVLLLSSVLLISLLTYSLAKKNSFENAQQSNAAALTQQLSLIDQELESVSSLAANILMTQSYMFAEWENSLSVGSIIDLNNYLKQQRSLIPYIDSIYLYYDKLDQIITSGLQARPLAEFADRGWTSAYGGNVQRTQWLVNRETHPEGTVAKAAEAPASERRWITLVQTMPLIGKPIGAIVINIDQDRLLDDYLQAYSSSAGEMLVLGPSGEFLYGGDELRTNGDRIVKIALAQRGGDSIVATVAHQKQLITTLESGATHWRFVHLVPVAQLLAHIDKLKTVVFSVSLLYVAIAGVSAWYFSRRIYRPLAQSIAYIRRLEEETSDSRSEAELIVSVYDRLQRTRQQERQNHEDIVRQRLLLDMMQGLGLTQYKHLPIAPLEKEVWSAWEAQYTLILFEPESQSDGRRAEDNIQQQLSLLEWSDSLRKQVSGEVVLRDDGQIVVIVGGEPAPDMAAHWQRQALHFGLPPMTVGISELHRGIDRLEHAYRQANEALRRKLYAGRGAIIRYERLQDDGADRLQSYPGAIEKQLVQAIKDKDAEGVRQGLDSLKDWMLEHRPHPVVMQQAMTQIRGEMLKLIAGFGAEEQTLILQLSMPERHDMTLYEYIRLLQHIADALIEQYARMSSRAHDATLERAVRYIQDHYEQQLSVEQVAEHVRLSASYVNKLFKERHGTTINEYIIELKIGRAKRLLTDTDLVIEEISQQIGYNTLSYFTRLFKTKTGMTPGQYRRQHGAKPENT